MQNDKDSLFSTVYFSPVSFHPSSSFKSIIHPINSNAGTNDNGNDLAWLGLNMKNENLL